LRRGNLVGDDMPARFVISNSCEKSVRYLRNRHYQQVRSTPTRFFASHGSAQNDTSAGLIYPRFPTCVRNDSLHRDSHGRASPSLGVTAWGVAPCHCEPREPRRGNLNCKQQTHSAVMLSATKHLCAIISADMSFRGATLLRRGNLCCVRLFPLSYRVLRLPRSGIALPRSDSPRASKAHYSGSSSTVQRPTRSGATIAPPEGGVGEGSELYNGVSRRSVVDVCFLYIGLRPPQNDKPATLRPVTPREKQRFDRGSLSFLLCHSERSEE